MRKIVSLCLISSVAACTQMAQQPAQNEGQIGVGVSTLGFVIEPSVRVNDDFGGRAIIATGSYSGQEEADGITYDADITVGGFGAMADYYPGGGNVRLSGGVLANNLEVEGRATGSVDVGANTYVGVDLTSTIAPENSLSPMVSIGIDQPINENFSFTADLGAVFVGDYSASVEDANGIVSTADIQSEISSIEDELGDASIIPYVKIGGAYRW